ncbi:MAG: hypothetical protein D6690_07670 [Nitrospirae bacterium]|nr:MAG: hypothetical protein D6690_07670 [Nitrospirota bacterium]
MQPHRSMAHCSQVFLAGFLCLISWTGWPSEVHSQAGSQELHIPAQVAALTDPITHKRVERLIEAGRLMPQNDALFDEILGRLATLKRASSHGGATTTQPLILALQEAALGTSTVSTKLALLNEALTEFLPVLPLLESNALDQLGHTLDRYEETESTFLRAALILRQQLTAEPSSSDSRDVMTQLSTLQNATQAFNASQTDYSQTITELTGSLARFSARRGGERDGIPSHPIHGNVFAFFDRDKPEDEGYGLYTYLVFSGPSPRNTMLLNALIESTSASNENIARRRAYLNLFVIPTHSRMKAWRLVRRQPHDLEAFGNRPGDQT